MLEPGDVFLIRDFRNTGYDPHYQIVIHKTKEGGLLLVYCTKQIEKVKKQCIRDSANTPEGELPSTYVEIPAGKCDSLPILCAVSCDKAFLSTEADREGGMDFKKKEQKLPSELLQKIADGIRGSDMLPDLVKDALKL